MATPLIQTLFFQQSRSEAERQRHLFIDPIQCALADSFPAEFNFYVLSAVLDAPCGALGLTHVVEFDGDEILRFEHPPCAILQQGGGVAFRLELTDLRLERAGTLVVKTTLTDGTKGQDVPLPVALR